MSHFSTLLLFYVSHYYNDILFKTVHVFVYKRKLNTYYKVGVVRRKHRVLVTVLIND